MLPRRVGKTICIEIDPKYEEYVSQVHALDYEDSGILILPALKEKSGNGT